MNTKRKGPNHTATPTKRRISSRRRPPTKRTLVHALNVALQQLDRKSEPCYNASHGRGCAPTTTHGETPMANLHHTIIKAVAAAGCKIEEVTGQSYKFVLTHEELALRATGDDARELRKLAQEWANDENTEDYGVEDQVEEHDEPEEDEGPSGSLIKDHYKQQYADAGHPDDCGDWLADTLRKLTHDANGFVRDRFTAICEMNGITDWAKYLTGPERGQNGRLKMSCGNRLRAIVRRTGKLNTPGGGVAVPRDFIEKR